jgi:hypothetical protein
MLGSESAIEGASADESGARNTLVESRGSNVDILVQSMLTSTLDRSSKRRTSKDYSYTVDYSTGILARDFEDDALD